MIKQPYPDQELIIAETSKALKEHQSVILQAPGGFGKTVVMLIMILRGLKKGRTFLVISETAKIYEQLVKEFNGIEINSDVKRLQIEENNCYVAMSQTLQRREKILQQLAELGDKLIVMADEAHINTMTGILLQLKEAGALIIGATATPFFKFHKHLPEVYNHLVHGPQIEELIQNKRLCNYKHIARTRGDMSLLELRNGEYTEQSQDKVFTSRAVYAGLFEDLRTVPFKKCIIFVASKKAADDLNKQLNDEGFASSVFHSSVQHKNYELAKFTQLHLTNILVSIRSLSKGWDYKPIDLVVLNHKTASTSLYLQEIFRGSRIIVGEKEDFTVLDYGDNWKQHGLYYEHRDFTKLWNEAPKKKNAMEATAPVRMCLGCEAILPTSKRTCPYCDFEFPVDVKELEIGELIEITKDYSSLAGRKVSELDPLELSVYVKTMNKKPYGARVARAREQQSAGYLAEYARHMGYKDSWVEFQKKMIGEDKVEYADLVLR